MSVQHLISVVVPAYNAEAHIRECLDSLLVLDYPKDRLEILVVDNGSTDHTLSIIKTYPVRCLVEDTPGSAAARNLAARSARGEIIAFTDADCVVDVNWAKEIDLTFQDPQVDAVMGFAEGINDNFWASLEQRNFEEFWYRRGSNGYTLKRSGLDTRIASIRKRVLETCGYFSANLLYCADLDLSTRLNRWNYHIAFNDRIRVRHRNRTDLNHILRIKERHARAFLQIVEQHPGGWDCPDFPSNIRSFLGVDNRSIQGLTLEGALLGFKVLGSLLSLAVRVLSLILTRPNTVSVKLFKTLCGVTWETTILKEKRRKGQS